MFNELIIVLDLGCCFCGLGEVANGEMICLWLYVSSTFDLKVKLLLYWLSATLNLLVFWCQWFFFFGLIVGYFVTCIGWLWKNWWLRLNSSCFKALILTCSLSSWLRWLLCSNSGLIGLTFKALRPDLVPLPISIVPNWPLYGLFTYCYMLLKL